MLARIAAAAEAAADSSSITAAVAATAAAAAAFAYPLYNLYQPLHSSPLSSSNVSTICSLPSMFRNEPRPARKASMLMHGGLGLSCLCCPSRTLQSMMYVHDAATHSNKRGLQREILRLGWGVGG